MMKSACALILLILILPSLSSAQEYMDLKWNVSSKQIISGMDVADIDLDGNPDIAISGSSDGSVYVYDNEGMLVWKKDVFAYINTVEVADVAKDPGLEVITGHADMSVFNSSGERLFKYNTPPGMNVYEIVEAQLDSDSLKELVFTSYDPDRCSRDKVATVYALDADTKETKFRYALDKYIPEVVKAYDFDQDGLDEIILGLTYRVVGNNRVCARRVQEPSKILVLNANGDVVLDYDTKGAVMSVDVGDVDGDGKKDIIGGGYPDAFAITYSGVQIFDQISAVTTYVEKVLAYDADGDGVDETVMGSSEVHVLDKNGQVIWTGLTDSRIYSLASIDVDGDGKDEVVAGSGSVYIFASDGKQLWRSPSHTSYQQLMGSNLDNNEFTEVVAASVKDLYVFQTQEYAKRVRADRMYDSALADPIGSYSLSELEEAKKLYSELGMIDKVAEVVNLINERNKKEDAMKDLATQAKENLEMAQQFLDQKNYINSSRLAHQARSKYSSLNDEFGKQNAEKIILQLNSTISAYASQELLLANESFHKKEYEQALMHAATAKEHYLFIGDMVRAEKAGLLSDNIKQMSGLDEDKDDEGKLVSFDINDVEDGIANWLKSINPLYFVVLLAFIGFGALAVATAVFAVNYKKKMKPAKHPIKYHTRTNLEEDQELKGRFRRRRAKVVKYNSSDEDEIKEEPDEPLDISVSQPRPKGVFRAEVCRDGLCINVKKSKTRRGR